MMNIDRCGVNGKMDILSNVNLLHVVMTFSYSYVTKLIAVSSDMLLVLSTYSLGRKTIDLGNKNIGDASAQALARILQHCTNLQELE